MKKTIILFLMSLILLSYLVSSGSYINYIKPDWVGSVYFNETALCFHDGTCVTGNAGTYDLDIAGDAGAGKIDNVETLTIIGAGSVTTSFDGIDTLTITGTGGGGGNFTLGNMLTNATALDLVNGTYVNNSEKWNSTNDIWKAISNNTFQTGTELFNSTNDIWKAISNNTFQTGSELYNSTNDIWKAISNNTFQDALYSSVNCAGTDKVVNVSLFENGTIGMVCSTDLQGAGGGTSLIDIYPDMWHRFNLSKTVSEYFDLESLNATQLCLNSSCINAWREVNGTGGTVDQEQVQDWCGAMAGAHLTYTDGIDDLSVNDDWWDACADAASCAWSSFGASVDDTEMTAEDFGDWSCTGGEDGCTIDAAVLAPYQLTAGAWTTTNDSINYGTMHTFANHSGMAFNTTNDIWKAISNNTYLPTAWAFTNTNFSTQYYSQADRFSNTNFSTQYFAQTDRFTNTNFSIRYGATHTFANHSGMAFNTTNDIWQAMSNESYFQNKADTNLNLTTYNVTNSFGSGLNSNSTCIWLQGDDGSRLKVGSSC